MSNSEIKKLLRQLKEREHKKDWKGESEICSALGELYFLDGDLNNALHYHQQDRQACDCIGDKKGMAQAMRKIGEVYAEQQNYKKSLENQNGYLEIARELGDLPEEQRALATLGRTHLYMSESELCDKQQELKKAKTFFKMCLSAAEKITTQVDHREKQEMRGRAQENLGTVYWHLGNKAKAAIYQDLAEEAFKTLKDGNEDLCRLLDGMASLHIEDKSFDVALRLCDKSIDAAKGVRHDRDKLVCGSLLTKSKVLLFRKDFDSSKSCLRAAYKLNVKTGVSEEVKRNLKMMKVIVEAQDEMDENSHKNYEKIADTLLEYTGNSVELKYVHEMAIHYYKLALARADNNGDQSAVKDLNWSIADTYKDMGEYEFAKTYFERQLQYQSGRPLEQCLTKSNIANVMDFLGEDFERIARVIRSWRDLAKEAGDVKQEVIALEELAKLEETRGKDPSRTKEIIEKLRSEIPEEDLVSSSQGSVDKLADVNIDEVDTSDEDEEVSEKPRRYESLKIKRKFTQNNVGEFPLHIQVKNSGNEKSIRKLIEEGHPLEAKDHAGWTPLGEAANTGITEYAKILVEAGANINAKEDLGFTPLMSASFKGHLDIVEFLLRKEAKVQLRNRNNETALSFLRDHHKEARNPKSVYAEGYNRPGVREQIDRLIEKMEEAFVKLGLPVDRVLPVHESSDEEEEAVVVDEIQEKEIRRNRLSLGKNRTQRSRDDSFSDSGPITSTQRSVSSNQKHRSPPLPAMSQIPARNGTLSASQFTREDKVGASQYKDAICRVGSSAIRANNPSVAPLKPKNGPKAYNDVDNDDWLEVDVVTPTVKKRKRSGGEGSVNRKEAKKRSDVFGCENKRPGHSSSRNSRRSSDEFAPPTYDLTDDANNSPVFKLQPKSVPKRPGLLSTKSYKKQPKISNFVTRTSRSPSPNNIDIPQEMPTSPLLKKASSSLQKVSSFSSSLQRVSSHSVPEPSIPQIVVAAAPTQRVKVRVKERLLLIPIPASEKDLLKVSWLSSEASARYCRAEGAEPVLKLTTVDGAEFDPDDLLSVAIPIDSNEILETQVIRWNNKPINQRYKDACNDLKSTCFKNITEQLSICETTHILALKVPLKSSSAEPIFRSIRSSPGLKELRLTNCRLGDGCLPLLASVLPTLPALTTINLSNNRLSYTSLSLLAQTFHNSPPPLLSSLDLSHNPLGDLSCPDLARIVNSCPQLTSLFLTSCWFTVSLFQSGRLDLSQAFTKVNLRHLTFSHNKIGPTGVELLLKTLPPTLRHLDISGCVDESLQNLHFSQYLLRYVKLGNPEVELNHLNVSNLQLHDVNIPFLCSSLEHLGHLKHLDLSYNHFTNQGLAQLLTAANTHNAPIATLNLRGCEQVWDKGVEEFLEAVEARLGEGGMEVLVVPDSGQAKRLRRDWDLAWRDRSRHRVDVTGHLILSID